MQRRVLLISAWPRLIGVASGTFGAAVTIAAAAQLSGSGSLRAQTIPENVALICGCVFLFLAFPLFTGRDWARRALLFAIYSTLAAVAISFSVMVVQRSSSASGPARSLLIGAYALVGVLTPPLSFWLPYIMLTSNAHIGRRKHPTRRWSERRTAARFTLEMISTLHPEATRVDSIAPALSPLSSRLGRLSRGRAAHHDIVRRRSSWSR